LGCLARFSLNITVQMSLFLYRLGFHYSERHSGSIHSTNILYHLCLHFSGLNSLKTSCFLHCSNSTHFAIIPQNVVSVAAI
jgi:hypothetical protein